MHLVVLQHGVWGTPSNTKYLANLLTERLGNTAYILNFCDNVKFATYDGIDVCGERLFQGVKSAHDNLVHQSTPPTHISFIGYGVGGLIARYAVGRLFSEGYFDHVAPLNFVTIATPHLSSWRQPTSVILRLLNACIPAALARTGAQLYLRDATPWGAPLLCVLSHPGLNFTAALRSFKNIVAMANVRHDRAVTFCSAAMQLEDPYPLRGFERGVAPVDPAYGSVVRPRKSGEELPDPSSGRRPLRGRVLLALLILATALLFPLALLVCLLALLHGWRRSGQKRVAMADDALQDLYTSWTSYGNGNGGGGSKLSSPSSLQGPEASQGMMVIVDVEIGIQTRVGSGGSDGSYGGSPGLLKGSLAAGGDGGGGGSSRGNPEDRVPLHKDHLRQQQQQQQLFSGLPPVTDKRALQEWLVTQLQTLSVRKVHVDTRNVLNAHSTIVAGSRLFQHCRDAVQYLVDQCMVWS